MTNVLRFLPLLAAIAACTSSTATVQLQPQPGWNGSASVLVHTPAGVLVSQAPITSSLAVALSDGDTVTVVLQADGNTALMSSLDVQRGDTIELAAPDLGSTTEVNVNVPQVAGATTWQVASPNSFASAVGTPPNLTLYIPAGVTSTPVIGGASSDTSALAMYAETDASITGASPALTLQDSVAFTSVTVTAINLPAGTGSNFGVGGDVYIGGQELSLPMIGSDVLMPKTFGDGLDAVAAVFGSDSLVTAGSVLSGVPSSAVSIDLSVPHLPQLAELTLSTSGASWTLTGSGSYDELELELSSSTNANTVWSITAPPSTTSITLPTLPTGLTVPTFDTAELVATQASSVDGYAAALHEPATFPAGTTFETRALSVQPATAGARTLEGRVAPRSPIARIGATHFGR